jgi:hypothetical protein
MSFTRTAILKRATGQASGEKREKPREAVRGRNNTGQTARRRIMPHTDTNISRDALRSYGMQPSGRQDSRQRGKEADKERRFMVYGDAAVNPAKVYVDVLAEFTREGVMMPCRITWEDGRKYTIDRIKKCERRASRRAGGMGLMYTCMVGGHEVNLFYEENMRWFVTRK